MNSTKWEAFEADVEETLEAVLSGSISRKLETVPRIIHMIGKETFGVEERREKKIAQQTKSKRECKIESLRREIRALKRQYKTSTNEEKPGITTLKNTLHSQITSLRRAERNHKKWRQRTKARKRFVEGPFKFVKQLLGSPKSGELENGMNDIEAHLAAAHCDPNREQNLPELDDIIKPQAPDSNFDMGGISRREVLEVIVKARTKSAPGYSGTSYKVYKKCPKLVTRLAKLVDAAWKKKVIPECWQRAEGCFVPKEENSRNIKEFRTISLLSIECKIFFAIMSKRLTKFMLDNGYIDISIQKGGIRKVSGCIEHTAVLTQLIKETKAEKGNLATIRLDLTNAYGSIPHKLVEETLRRYHVPEKVRTMLRKYYDNFYLRFSCASGNTRWQRLEKGIITGDTISVILFARAINLMVKSSERSKGPKQRSGTRHPPIKAFMDDMTVSTNHAAGARWTLAALEKTMKWARMQFNAKKSRSIVLRRGRIDNTCRFQIGGEPIPTVSEKPIKYLGKRFDETLKDQENTFETINQLDRWLAKIDKSELPGKFKAWCAEHGIIPRISWPLMIYDIPISTVVKMERKISGRLRTWLGIPKSFTNIGLYGKTTKLRLPFTSLVEECKVIKTRTQETLDNAKDPLVRSAGVQLQCGNKWSVRSTLQEAECRLKHKDLIGLPCLGRQGIGYSRRKEGRYDQANEQQRRAMISNEIRRIENEQRLTRAVAMRKQGAWMKWEGAECREITWNNLWKIEPMRIRFIARATYDLLPTPTNLATWGITDDPSCRLCGRPGNLEHVLSSCSTALSQHRYTWRHDRVLEKIAHHLLQKCQKANITKSQKKQIAFVRQGENTKKEKQEASRGILGTARDWELKADLRKQLVIPIEISVTRQRPDIVIISRQSKRCIILELTVPWEERIEEAYERKAAKYEELVNNCKENGWKTWCFPFEIGCRGFIGRSANRAMSIIGLTGKEKMKMLRDASDQAERASNWLWMKREDPN